MLSLLSAGDHVVACDDLYGGTYRLFSKVLARLKSFGRETTARTITVFTSDHGYQLGELNLWGKLSNTELGTRTPVIMYYGANPPDPPLVRFLDSTTASITLGWDLPLDDGGIAPNRYIVMIDDGMGGPFEEIYDGPSMAATATGLATGYTYRFTVTAASPAGTLDICKDMPESPNLMCVG